MLFGHDPDDPATAPAPRPDLLGIASRPPPVPPTLAFVRPPGWEQAHPDLHSAFADLQNHLGDRMFEVALPEVFAQAARQHRIINLAEMAKAYFRYGRQRDQLGAKLGAALQDGEGIPARDYLAALDWKPVLYAGLGEIFTRCDAIVTPAAPGPAPHGLSSTGDASFNALWTLLGTPAGHRAVAVGGKRIAHGGTAGGATPRRRAAFATGPLAVRRDRARRDLMNRIMAVLAFGVLAGFLGILLWHVPETDLIIVAAVVIALAAWDFLTSSGGNGSR